MTTFEPHYSPEGNFGALLLAVTTFGSIAALVAGIALGPCKKVDKRDFTVSTVPSASISYKTQGQINRYALSNYPGPHTNATFEAENGKLKQVTLFYSDSDQMPTNIVVRQENPGFSRFRTDFIREIREKGDKLYPQNQRF